MKLKQKGIAPLIIVVIVVVAVAVVGVGAYIVTRGGGGPGGTSVYPGAQEFTQMTIEQALQQTGQSLPAGWSGKIYTTSDSASSVMSWYRTQMTGWEKVFDNTIDYEYGGYSYSVGILAYTKGSDGAFILTFEATGVGTVIVVASGPASGLENMA
jgi:hypothetical protein